MKPKPFDQLASNDLSEFPIWSHVLDHEDLYDETYVVPVKSNRIPRDNNQYHCACTVEFPNGVVAKGIITICNGSPDDDAPAILEPLFWHSDFMPKKKELVLIENYVGLEYMNFFPLKWRTLIEDADLNRPIEGVYSDGARYRTL